MEDALFCDKIKVVDFKFFLIRTFELTLLLYRTATNTLFFKVLLVHFPI